MVSRLTLQTLAEGLLTVLLFGASAAMAQQVCTLQPWLPEDFEVFLVHTYKGTSGLSEQVQLDASGNGVTKVDVVVNYPVKPVVLILTAYDPVVWNVSWAPGSKIVGAFISGYHAQAIIGIPRWIPLLRSSYDQRNESGGCPYFTNRQSGGIKDITGKLINSSMEATVGGPTWVGEKDLSVLPKVLRSDQYSIADFAVKRVPNESKAGPVGLQELVSKGSLRAGTLADFWLAMTPAAIMKRVLRWNIGVDLPPTRTYLVLRKMTLPDGLHGAHSAVFIVPWGVPRPDGPIGHSTIYVASEGMKCTSPVCREDD